MCAWILLYIWSSSGNGNRNDMVSERGRASAASNSKVGSGRAGLKEMRPVCKVNQEYLKGTWLL